MAVGLFKWTEEVLIVSIRITEQKETKYIYIVVNIGKGQNNIKIKTVNTCYTHFVFC